MAAAVLGAAILIVTGVTLFGGGSSTSPTRSVPASRTPATTNSTAAKKTTVKPVTKSEAGALANRYAAVYSTESISELKELLAPNFERKSGNGPRENLTQALATYRSQFNELTNPTYTLSGLSIETGKYTATVTGNYRITSASGTSTGFVAMAMVRMPGKPLQIVYLNAVPHNPPSSNGGTGSPGSTGSAGNTGSSGSSTGSSGSSEGGSGESGSGSAHGGTSGRSGDGGGLLWYGPELPITPVPDLN